MKINIRLTKKEEQILTVLWDAKKSLSVVQIIEHAKTMGIELNQSTVQMTVNKLIKGNVIKIGEIIQSGKVLARTFEPVYSPDDWAVLKFQSALSNKSAVGLFSALLRNIALSDDEVEDLKNIIKEIKK